MGAAEAGGVVEAEGVPVADEMGVAEGVLMEGVGVAEGVLMEEVGVAGVLMDHEEIKAEPYFMLFLSLLLYALDDMEKVWSGLKPAPSISPLKET